MRFLIYILLSLTLFSCVSELTLSKKGFNKAVDIGVKKGWIDTSSKTIDSVFNNPIDTSEIKSRIEKVIVEILKDTTIYKDTCYDKKGNKVGKFIDKQKLETKLKDKIKDSLVIPSILTCLSKPLFFDKDGVLVELTQDKLGNFYIKVKVKDTKIYKQEERTWFQKQKEVWYLYLFILLLIILIYILAKK